MRWSRLKVRCSLTVPAVLVVTAPTIGSDAGAGESGPAAPAGVGVREGIPPLAPAFGIDATLDAAEADDARERHPEGVAMAGVRNPAVMGTRKVGRTVAGAIVDDIPPPPPTPTETEAVAGGVETATEPPMPLGLEVEAATPSGGAAAGVTGVPAVSDGVASRNAEVPPVAEVPCSALRPPEAPTPASLEAVLGAVVVDVATAAAVVGASRGQGGFAVAPDAGARALAGRLTGEARAGIPVP